MKNRMNNGFAGQKRDREAAAALKRRLHREARHESARVHCEVTDGTAILWGHVESRAARDRVVDVARRCPGVQSVHERVVLTDESTLRENGDNAAFARSTGTAQSQIAVANS